MTIVVVDNMGIVLSDYISGIRPVFNQIPVNAFPDAG
jgi:hypothetical protein